MKTVLLIAALIAIPVSAHAPPLEQLPDTALAQTPAPPAPEVAPAAPSIGQQLGSQLLSFVSPGGVATVLGVVGSLVAGVAWLTSRRKRIIASLLHRAYQGVNDIAASDEVTDGWDKTAAYLAEIDKRLVALGWRPLDPEEQEVAKLEAKALHGAEQQAIKIASAAAVAGSQANP
jgi:hypothetical protein